MDKDLILVHYGSKVYDSSKFLSPYGTMGFGNKPVHGTGLWTSPVDSNWGWKDWNECEQYSECCEENCFYLLLPKESKVLIIDSLQDLKEAVGTQESLDFEALAKVYDVIWLTEKGQEDTRHSHPNLYGWDCESVLILNKDCVSQIEYTSKVSLKEDI